MEQLTLYRGITVRENDVDKVVTDIKNNGLSLQKSGQWKGGFAWRDLRGDLLKLSEKKDLSTNDTRPESLLGCSEKVRNNITINDEVGICFADRSGANYYAFEHNFTRENKVPIVITVNVNINDVAVDGRDFLYTVFGFIGREDSKKTELQREALIKIYGDKINSYVHKLMSHPDSDRFAICDLAIVDNEIIEEHTRNEILILGRSRTRFKSAFFVKAPIDKKCIQNIQVNEPYLEARAETIALWDLT